MSEKDKLFKAIRYILIGSVVILVVKYSISYGFALKLYLDNKEMISEVTNIYQGDLNTIVKETNKLTDQQQFEAYLKKNNISIVTENYYSLLVEKYNLIDYTLEDYLKLDQSLRTDIGAQGGQLGQQYLNYYFKWNESK